MARQFFLDRPALPQNYGDLLRNAGLNEGVSWGGSEIDLPETFTSDQIARALALGQGDAPNISNQDVLRFLAQQNPGGLPGLGLTSGGGDNEGGGRTGGVSASARGGGEAQAGRDSTLADPGALTGSPNLGSLGRGLDSALAAINGPTGQLALDAAQLGLSGIPFGGLIPGGVRLAARGLGMLGPFGKEDLPPALPETPPLNQTPEPEPPGKDFVNPDPTPSIFVGEPQLTPEQEPPGPVPDAGPPGQNPDDPTNQNEGALGTGGPGPGASGAVGGQAEGETGGGTGGGGPSGGGGEGTGAGTGGEGPEARGGRIPTHWRNPSPALSRGNWKGAAKFQAGGPVPSLYSRGGPAVPSENEKQARARRVADFEKRFSEMPV